MNRPIVRAAALLVFCVPLAFAAPPAVGGKAAVTDGDLRGTVKLSGEWQFVWGRLVPPAEFAAVPAPASVSIGVPGFWTRKEAGFPAVGSATYRLVVELPEAPAEPVGLYLTQISNAYRVYGNGTLLAENGRVSERGAEVRGVLAPRTVFLSASGRLEIVVQVSNADDLTAGINAAPVLGYQTALAPLQGRSTLLDGLIYAGILIMGLYHILLAVLRPEERASLYFGLLGLDLALRGLLTGSRILHQYLGGLGYHALISVEYATVYLALLLIFLYFYHLFPRERPGFVRVPLIAVTASMCLYVVFAPIPWISPVHLGYEILLLAVGVLILVWLIRAIAAGRDGSVLMLIGFLVMLGGTVYDIVLDMRDGGSFFLSSYAMLVFVFLQALLIASRYAGAFRSVKDRSRENEELAASYGRFVPREFLALLGKDSIVHVELGDQVEMEMTVLFSDIRSFTSLSENMGPKENFNFLNSYLKRISPVIRRNHGFIDKYLGDGIMALFPGSAADALRASAEMRETMREYNRHRARSGYREISIGIGINRGRLMLGTIGEESRMEGTVISDVVNLASRLEGLTRTFGASVLVSGEVVSACPDRAGLPSRYLGRTPVKGKAQAVAVHELFEPAEFVKLETRIRFEEAVHAYEAQRFEEAMAGFEAVAAEDPSDGAARWYLGRLVEIAGRGRPEPL